MRMLLKWRQTMIKWSVKVKCTAEFERIVELFAESQENAEQYAAHTILDDANEEDGVKVLEAKAVKHVEREFEIIMRAK